MKDRLQKAIDAYKSHSLGFVDTKRSARERALATLTVAESLDFYKGYVVVHLRDTKTTIKIFDASEYAWLWELTNDQDS